MQARIPFEVSVEVDGRTLQTYRTEGMYKAEDISKSRGSRFDFLRLRGFDNIPQVYAWSASVDWMRFFDDFQSPWTKGLWYCALSNSQFEQR